MKIDKIEAFVSLGYHDPDLMLTSTGDLEIKQINPISPSATLGASTDYAEINQYKELLSLFRTLLQASKCQNEQSQTNNHQSENQLSVCDLAGEINTGNSHSFLSNSLSIIKTKIKEIIEAKKLNVNTFTSLEKNIAPNQPADRLQNQLESVLNWNEASLNENGIQAIITALETVVNDKEFVYNGNLDENQIVDPRFQILDKTGNIIERIGAFSEAAIASLRAGFIQAEKITTKQFSSLSSNIYHLSSKLIVSDKIVSPIVETTDLVATGTASLNEIRPVNNDLIIDLSQISPTPPISPNAGALAKLIIRGLEGKTAVVIDAGGNASFSGQITADSLRINTDASISGTLTASEASLSGKLIAKEVDAENIQQLQQQVNDLRESAINPRESFSINDIQKLLADIKTQPIPDPTNYQNLDPSFQILDDRISNYLASNIQDLSSNNLTVTGHSNLYTVSVSNSLLVGTTIIDQNSIISLASELKLSALSRINLFDGAVVIAKDGTITTRGEIIAQGGIRTNEIKPLTDDGQVTINNLAINNLTINDKYLAATDSAAIIAANKNFNTGIIAPDIETASASAGLGILPENSQEVVIYNSLITPDSLIYLTPISPISPITLSVGEKSTGAKPYFKVTSFPSTLPIKFNWLIVN